MSDAWTRFHDSVTGAVSSRDSLEQFDLGALASLDAAGREQAEALLASRLDHDDPRVVAALAQLSTPSASVLLRGLADRPEASFMRIAAVALLRDAAAMADVLTRTGRDDLRIAAAVAAASLPSHAELDAGLLAAARACHEPTARHALVDAALTRRGRGPSLRTPPDASFWVLPLVASPVPAVRAWGLARLETAGPPVARQDPRYDRLRDALGDPAAPLDEVLTPLASDVDDRAWAIDALVWRLGKGDARAPAAMVRLGAHAARPALEAVAQNASGDLAAEVARALGAL